MNELILFLIIIITGLSFMNYLNKQKNIKYETSNIDDRKYLVRKLKDSKDAANKLAELNGHIFKIIDHCQTTKKENIKLLKENYNPDTLSETIPGSKYTSYSVNKGEEIAICIRNKDNTFMNINTILFVTIHELAHVMTLSTGHTKEFWNNMKYLLEEAEKINLYKPVNYNKYNESYCGMTINSTPYDFDNKKDSKDEEDKKD